MGLSSALLIVSVLGAGAALGATKMRMPASLVQLLIAAASAGAAVLVGLGAVAVASAVTLFGVVHLLYLCIVVGAPVVFGCWAVAGWRRGDRSSRVVGAGLVATALIGIGVYATHVEPNRLRVDRATLVSSGITEPLRIGVLSDLQTPNVGRHERSAVEKLLAGEPDLVVVPGDLYQGAPDVIAANRADFVDLLVRLVDRVELVVVVSGDSDSPRGLRPMVEEAGATFLDNTGIDATIAGVDVRLVGVDVVNHLSGDALKRVLGPGSTSLTILISHRPDVVSTLLRSSGVDLVVAGHSHGGQVALPFFGPLVTFSGLPRSVAAGGLSEVDGVPIYVSTGVGLERRQAPQVRFGVRPSIGIIDIVPAE